MPFDIRQTKTATIVVYFSPMDIHDLISYSYELGKRVLESRNSDTLKEHGQFLTPANIARYMAQQMGEIHTGAALLEPACGSGVLICAVIENLIAKQNPIEIQVTAYEIDYELAEICRQVLEVAGQKAEKHGIKIHWQVLQKDFVLDALPEQQATLFGARELTKSFDFVISNPPYFKLNAQDERVKAVAGKLNGQTNIYTLFMALSVKLLAPNGKSCFIVPRSFCSGVYFSEFRRDLLRNITPLAVHMFQSRNIVFKTDEILQENVIFSFEKLAQPAQYRYFVGAVDISTSVDDTQLESAISRQVAFRHFFSHHDGLLLFRLPTGMLDEQILDAVDHWDGSLEKCGFQVSTGRVVPFRAKSLLKESMTQGNDAAPLLWMQNIKPYQVEYPVSNLGKPQAISTDDPSLLVPQANYVLLRRFSAKEDRRRLVSAPFLGKHFGFELIGFENHLNVIYKKKGALSEEEAIGLSALFNSAIIDRYFRITNGNTQINAAELRALPLPPLQVIKNIGSEIQKIQNPTFEQADRIVFSVLWQTNLIAEDFPMIQETRILEPK